MRLALEILERHRDAIPDLGGQPAVMRALFDAVIKEIEDLPSWCCEKCVGVDCPGGPLTGWAEGAR